MKLSQIIFEEESVVDKPTIVLNTYGDLKKLLNTVNKSKKLQTVVSKGKSVAVELLVGLIPGGSAAKTGYDLLKGFINKPDTKTTNTWLDRLDIDDKMSAIVDDTVENGFIQAMFKVIAAEPDNKPLEDSFDMNDKMAEYLKQKYNSRTIVGYK